MFAAMGGLVRELVNPKEHTFFSFISGAFIGIFTGLVVYFGCKYYDVNEYLSISMTGLGGYIGAPLLDLLGKIFKGKVKNLTGSDE